MNKNIMLIGIAALVVFGGKKVTDNKDTSANETKYRALIAATEQKNGIPSGILHRLIMQESHFRTDIITGATRSKTGALGIAQFMPSTAKQELGSINAALNPLVAIEGAGRYLAKLYKSTGNWTSAVAAYNWGIGNVQKFKAGTLKKKGRLITQMPTETQKYIAAIIV